MASSDDKRKASPDGKPKRNKKKKDKLPQNEIRKDHQILPPFSPSSGNDPPLSPSSAASDEEADEADYISPQQIHEQRVKEAEREQRETARTTTARTAADGPVQDEVTDNANPRQRYPVEMEKYWNGYFQNQGDLQSKNAESDSATTPHVRRQRNMAAPQWKPPGAYSLGGEDSSRQRQEVLDKDEEAALSTSPPPTTGNNGEDDDATLLEANKVEDVDVIINATDVRRDSFRQKTILASICLLGIALGLGLYFGLRSDETSFGCQYNDPRCCDYSNEPIEHLALLSCSCFNNTDLVFGKSPTGGDGGRSIRGHEDVKFNQTLFDEVKKLYLDLHDSEENVVQPPREELKAFVEELRGLNGHTCHPFDQLLQSLREHDQKQIFALGTIFVSTGGIGWEGSDGWFVGGQLAICRWFGIGCLFEGFVTSIELKNNNLKGEIPSGIFLFRSLQELDLSENFDLTGRIPSELGALEELSSLALSETGLTGTIPDTLTNLQQLHDLSLVGAPFRAGQFSGSIPHGIFNNPFLLMVDLKRNDFSSSLPSEVGNATNLQALTLKSSKMRGALPTELGRLSRLQVLDVSNNQLSGGNIPSELGTMTRLEFLNLANSGLNETIPEIFCEDIQHSKGFVVGSDCSKQFPLCSCCIRDKDIGANVGGDLAPYFIEVTCIEEPPIRKEGEGEPPRRKEGEGEPPRRKEGEGDD
eukprot:scaffold1276_cov99-Cylindrotheca_fusiformis.AAC.3